MAASHNNNPQVQSAILTAQSGGQAEAAVLFDTVSTQCGHLIGIMTLNAPQSLNALSVEMCHLLSAQLTHWHADKKVVAVLLKGAGDKAFCAGGDIRKLYESMTPDAPMPNPYATEFFGQEYALFLQMHSFPKPLLLWGDGIIMGGGMGLLASCSHRIVTERTRFAMPEVSIGLFPDASGSWFLSRMPAKIGLFLGLTGVHCNANDALLVNLAEYAVSSTDYEKVLEDLCQHDWRAIFDPQQNDTAHTMVSQILASQSVPTLNDSKLAKYWQSIQRLMNSGGLANIDAILQDNHALAQLDADFAQDSWTQKAVDSYRKGCPVTIALAYRLYNHVKTLSLLDILYLETNVAVHCAANPDFREGVRALLIDKDKNPQWSRSLQDCLTLEGRAYIDQHLISPYPTGEHPLDQFIE